MTTGSHSELDLAMVQPFTNWTLWAPILAESHDDASGLWISVSVHTLCLIIVELSEY